MNAELVTLLEELREIADIRGEIYREKAYKEAINEIKKLDYKISRRHPPDLKEHKIKGVGEGILSKILEYLKTGRIRELDKLRKSRDVLAHRIFSKIVGVGPATIEEWIDSGIYTLANLRKAIASGEIKLNNMQKLGLRYYDDLNERIPRDEVFAIGERIKQLIARVTNVTFEISGSYRRGAPTSGDIDIIITSNIYNAQLLKDVQSVLESDTNFIATLSIGPQRMTFLYAHNGKVRQVDILYIHKHQYWAAVCYFTGNSVFNQRLRGLAKKKGYRLNQNGLYKIVDDKLILVPINSEREIFDILGAPYVDPSGRNA